MDKTKKDACNDEENTLLKKKLKRFVELDNGKVIDLETLKCDWFTWGDEYTAGITVENGFLYQHTSKKVKPFETSDMGVHYIVDMFPRTRKLGRIIATGDTENEMVKL